MNTRASVSFPGFGSDGELRRRLKRPARDALRDLGCTPTEECPLVRQFLRSFVLGLSQMTWNGFGNALRLPHSTILFAQDAGSRGALGLNTAIAKAFRSEKSLCYWRKIVFLPARHARATFGRKENGGFGGAERQKRTFDSAKYRP